MNSIMKNKIDWLNYSTKNLNNLDELGIYLSKQTNVYALKTLKLLILAHETKYLDKPFNINAIKKYTEKFENNNIVNESIIGNLSMNPQNYGLEVMDFIIKNFKVNLTLEPFDSGYTIFDYFIRSFSLIEDDENLFYKRYDMIDKKLEIVNFMVENNILNSNQIYQIKEKFRKCINNKFSYTNEQLSKMTTTIDKINNFEEVLTTLKNSGLISSDISNTEIFDILLSKKTDDNYNNKRNENIINELNNYRDNDVSSYIANNIPILIKKKIIK